MTVEEHIAKVFRERLEQSACLVVYDPERRYQEIALGMADTRLRVVDAGVPVLLVRDEALTIWLDMVDNPDTRLLVYVPRLKPVDTISKQLDPFLIYRAAGAVFPDGAHDEYAALCRQAFPEHADQVLALFRDGVPDFAAVNALQAGPTWPRLRSLLKVESGVEILFAMLAPTQEQLAALQGDGGWMPEARELAAKAIGCALPAGEPALALLVRPLWKHLLFSEFALDLPMELPSALRDVPKAPASAEASVRRLCDLLRSNNGSQGLYVEHAERVQKELGLSEAVKEVADVGSVETFPVENEITFRKICVAIKERRIEDAQDIERANAGSIWRTFSPAHQRAWQIAKLATELIAEVDGVLRQADMLKFRTAEAAIALYAGQLSIIDRCHLALHGAWQATTEDEVLGFSLQELVLTADSSYRAYAQALQNGFVSSVVASLWPVSGFPRQMDVFERYVAPSVEKGALTGYLLVDALRFHLADDLQRMLPAGVTAEIVPCSAQLPSKTVVGMAALLPGAAGRLRVNTQDAVLSASISDEDVSTAPKRDEYCRRIMGDRCEVKTLDDVLAFGPRARLPEKVKLLVLRDSGIDKAGEADGRRLASALPAALTQIGKAVHRLRGLGVRRVIVAADHGFVYRPIEEPGDTVEKPAGDWVISKDRFLLGRGEETPSTVRFAPHDVGVLCDAPAIAFPRSLGAFQAGLFYYHGGLSLQECVIPVIVIDMPPAGRARAKPQIDVRYTGRSPGKISSRVFTVELSFAGGPALIQDWASDAVQVQFAVHREGSADIVGAIANGDHVDPSTDLVRISAGEKFRVPIRMVEDFRGRFIVKALDPVAGTRFAEVELQTDYME